MENNKNLWISLGVVAVIVIIIAVWSMHSGVPATETDTTGVTTPAPTAITSTEDVSAGSVDAGSGAATISYDDALVKYASVRLQLDTICQADAANQKMTVKNNTLIMVDNRSDVARTVHIGSVFTIKPYGFKIIKISSTTLPATWLVDCDSSQNVATILIQK